VKKINFFIYVIFLILISNYSYSQNIAYANLDLIIKNSNVGKKIITYFEDKNKETIKQIKNEEKKIREKEKSLISQKNILQEDEYLKKVNMIKKEVEVFNNNSKEKINQLNIKKEKISKLFLVEVNKILRDYAETNNIDIIFSSNQMLIGKSNLDLTKNILENVNNKINNFKIE
tara:strand:- start:103 stop:624 length:522 start_codon:yes stop_codon:yes gene_type:complete